MDDCVVSMKVKLYVVVVERKYLMYINFRQIEQLKVFLVDYYGLLQKIEVLLIYLNVF